MTNMIKEPIIFFLWRDLKWIRHVPSISLCVDSTQVDSTESTYTGSILSLSSSLWLDSSQGDDVVMTDSILLYFFIFKMVFIKMWPSSQSSQMKYFYFAKKLENKHDQCNNECQNCMLHACMTWWWVQNDPPTRSFKHKFNEDSFIMSQFCIKTAYYCIPSQGSAQLTKLFWFCFYIFAYKQTIDGEILISIWLTFLNHALLDFIIDFIDRLHQLCLN